MSQRRRQTRQTIQRQIESDEEDAPTRSSQQRQRQNRSTKARHRRTMEDIDEDAEEDQQPFTQPSQRKKSQRRQLSQGRNMDDTENDYTQSSQIKQLSQEEANQLVGSVIRYLLAVDRSKHVIQRQQLIKNVFSTYNKYYRVIIPKVRETLLQVFGFKLIEFETGKFIMTNAIKNDTPHLSCPLEDQPRRILLLLVLSHIFMSNNICKEEHLWSFLKQLQIIFDDNSPHPYFGNAMQLVSTEFVKQQYLDRKKIEVTDPPTYEFSWGARADEELSKREVLKFVSKIYNKPLNSWRQQLESVEATERFEQMQCDDD